MIILKDVWAENQSKSASENYVEKYFGVGNDPAAIGYNLKDHDSIQLLYVKLLGNTISNDSLAFYQTKLTESPHLNNAKLVLIQQR